MMATIDSKIHENIESKQSSSSSLYSFISLGDKEVFHKAYE